MQKPFYLLFASIIIAISTFSQAGTLDNSFSSDGKIITSTSTIRDAGQAMAIQTDGKILVIGFSNQGSINGNDVAVIRYNTDGTLDLTFDGDGIVTTHNGFNDVPFSVALQSDGKIVVGGFTNVQNRDHFFLVRYNTDGSLDATFDDDGKVVTTIGNAPSIIKSIAIQNDGKIVAVGYSGILNKHFIAARYNVNGTLDVSFNSTGTISILMGANDEANAVAIQSTGKIVIAGYSTMFNGANSTFALARLNTDGTLDNTFDGDGKLYTDFWDGRDLINGLVVQNDDKIVAAGIAVPNETFWAVARYNSNGTLDATFDNDGKVSTLMGNVGGGSAASVTLQNDGKIVVGGSVGTSYIPNGVNIDYAIARYNTNGSLDATFDGDGKVFTDFTGATDACLAIVAFGSRIYAAGHIEIDIDNSLDFSLAVYQSNITTLPLTMLSFTGAPTSNGTILQLFEKTISKE